MANIGEIEIRCAVAQKHLRPVSIRILYQYIPPWEESNVTPNYPLKYVLGTITYKAIYIMFVCWWFFLFYLMKSALVRSKFKYLKLIYLIANTLGLWCTRVSTGGLSLHLKQQMCYPKYSNLVWCNLVHYIFFYV